ncbi:hypothetical protein UH38_03555 [Aliterella atlantica CENA595]|uniref:Uncharacterized protein n=1 Tax=Aliterella atlantica CENA595 TaxID=1618023 RepID=A0A0D8ZWI3_9CYAN|nr:hypothetical protein UH38_03555 [Aliterella atlantica CENA595]
MLERSIHFGQRAILLETKQAITILYTSKWYQTLLEVKQSFHVVASSQRGYNQVFNHTFLIPVFSDRAC